jgi:mRNA interferase RelE/StbE
VRLFDIKLTETAVGDLDSIPDHPRKNILQAIHDLSGNPFLFGSNVKKLKGFQSPLYRLRSGDYRVLYRVMGETVTIMRVIDRKDLEKIIKRIKL